MAGDERVRLFCALQVPPAALDGLVAWQDGTVQGSGRVVPRENLHLTLAFLGSRPAGEVPAIASCLAGVAGDAAPVPLEPLDYRETRSVGMIVCADPTGRGASLARLLGERLENIGVYRRQGRPWLPHITVVRFKKREGLSFSVGNICSINVVRAALYASVLQPSGSRYDVLESVALGGR